MFSQCQLTIIQCKATEFHNAASRLMMEAISKGSGSCMLLHAHIRGPDVTYRIRSWLAHSPKEGAPSLSLLASSAPLFARNTPLLPLNTMPFATLWFNSLDLSNALLRLRCCCLAAAEEAAPLARLALQRATLSGKIKNLMRRICDLGTLPAEAFETHNHKRIKVGGWAWRKAHMYGCAYASTRECLWV